MSRAAPFILIRTPRLTLRPPCAGDLDAYAIAYESSRAHWKPALPTIDENAEASFRRILERHEIGQRQGTQLRLLGFLGDGRLAVVLALSEIVHGALEGAYAGWRTTAPLTGKGLASEGVAALLDLAFAPPPRGLGLHRVQANIMPTNIASIRVAEKTGFRREGLAQRYLLIDGKWQDHFMFAKVVDEHRQDGVRR
jgi:ribosomal-protein-alanine N-acetyltransferase